MFKCQHGEAEGLRGLVWGETSTSYQVSSWPFASGGSVLVGNLSSLHFIVNVVFPAKTHSSSLLEECVVSVSRRYVTHV